MTQEQMENRINEHCRGKSCNYCSIQYICAPIDGEFRKHPESCLEAMKVIAPETNIQSTVHHPSHYNQGGIECLDAMMAAYGKEATATFCLTNAFKYLWRTEHKNGIQDIDKAIWYLNKYKELKSSE